MYSTTRPNTGQPASCSNDFQSEVLIRRRFLGADRDSGCFEIEVYTPTQDRVSCGNCKTYLIPFDEDQRLYYCSLCGQIYMLIGHNLFWLEEEHCD